MKEASLTTQAVALPAELPPIPHATTNEKLIVGKLVTDLLAAGCLLTVNDGEDDVVIASTDAEAIYKAMSSTDEDWLIVSKVDGCNAFWPAWVRLVWGNDVDVISDYITRLEKLIAPANELAESLS